MKIYKVEFPDQYESFFLELMNHLAFVRYETSEPEPRTYIAHDYMIEKGLIPKEHVAKKVGAEDQQKIKMENMNNLRDAIDRIQSNRAAKTQKTVHFNLPGATGGAKGKDAHTFRSEQELKDYLEKYFRVGIFRLEFVPTVKGKKAELGRYEVKAHCKDSAGNMSEISAGFTDDDF